MSAGGVGVVEAAPRDTGRGSDSSSGLTTCHATSHEARDFRPRCDEPGFRIIAARRPGRVWLLAGHLPVEPGFLTFLREGYAEREHRALLGAEVWLFEPKSAGRGL